MALYGGSIAQGAIDYDTRRRSNITQEQIQQENALKLLALQRQQAAESQAPDFWTSLNASGAQATPSAVPPPPVELSAAPQPPAPPNNGSMVGGMQQPSLGGQRPQMLGGFQPSLPGSNAQLPPRPPQAGMPPGMAMNMQRPAPQQPPQIPPYQTVDSMAPPPGQSSVPMMQPITATPQPFGMQANGAPPAQVPQANQLPPLMDLFKNWHDRKIPANVQKVLWERVKPMYEVMRKSELENLARMVAYGKMGIAEKRENRLEDVAEKNIELMSLKAKVLAEGMAGAKPEALTSDGLKVAMEFAQAGKPIPGGWSKNGIARGNAILNELGRQEKGGAGSGQVTTDMASYKADTTSMVNLQRQTDAIEASTRSLHNNFDTLITLAGGVPQDKRNLALQKLGAMNFGDVKSVNEVEMWIKGQFSDPKTRAYMLAVNAVAMDYARIMGGPQSNAMLAEGARVEAMRLISGGVSVKALQGMKSAIERETSGQMEGKKTQLNEIRKRMSGRATESSSATRRSESGLPIVAKPEFIGPLIESGELKPGDSYMMDGVEKTLPNVGDVVDGYRYNGGDPGEQGSWEKPR